MSSEIRKNNIFTCYVRCKERKHHQNKNEKHINRRFALRRILTKYHNFEFLFFEADKLLFSGSDSNYIIFIVCHTYMRVVHKHHLILPIYFLTNGTAPNRQRIISIFDENINVNMLHTIHSIIFCHNFELSITFSKFSWFLENIHSPNHLALTHRDSFFSRIFIHLT